MDRAAAGVARGIYLGIGQGDVIPQDLDPTTESARRVVRGVDRAGHVHESAVTAFDRYVLCPDRATLGLSNGE